MMILDNTKFDFLNCKEQDCTLQSMKCHPKDMLVNTFYYELVKVKKVNSFSFSGQFSECLAQGHYSKALSSTHYTSNLTETQAC